MKTYKRKKISSKCEENEVDRISEMPDHIIESILSRIPSTEEVVRTSILSKRWTYLWTLLPSIDIDCTRLGLTPSDEYFDIKLFKKFVFRVLKWHIRGLESFVLCCLDYYSMRTVGKWIHEALKRKAKLLDLKFCAKNNDEDIVLPHCLVTSDSLEVLRLYLFRRPLLCPHDVGFPTLRVLELNSVTLFDDESVEKFLQNFPVLEDLCLIDCVLNELECLRISIPNLKTLSIDNREMVIYEGLDDGYDDDDGEYRLEGLCDGLQISCPKLVFFEYAGHIAYNFSFENLDSLKEAVLYPKDMNDEAFALEDIGDNMCVLFAGVSHVESLSLNLYFIQAINAAHDPYFPGSLPNLKTLEISTTMDANDMNVVIQFLEVSSKLESLYLVMEVDIIPGKFLIWEFDEFLTCHLKRVEFLYFKGEKHELDMARLILEHGNELEEMVFSWSAKVKYHEKSMKIMNKVSKFHKASLRVKLICHLND